jgi:hypothetical protein
MEDSSIFHKKPLRSRTRNLLRSRILMAAFIRSAAIYFIKALGITKSLLMPDQDLARKILKENTQK